MIIDMHLHTAEFSGDSVLPVEEAIRRGVRMGLSGICVTDHESLGILERAEELTRRYDFLVLPGVEILTEEGDFLAFGLEEVPPGRISFAELQELLLPRQGLAVAAHPYRDNGRGAGDSLFGLKEPFGIEVYNGRTKPHHNMQALETAGLLGTLRTGGSDAHTPEEVGRFATKIHAPVRHLWDFIAALREGRASPVAYREGAFRELLLEDVEDLQNLPDLSVPPLSPAFPEAAWAERV